MTQDNSDVDLSGRSAGPYQLVRLLARGTSADTYLGKRSGQPDAAVKVRVEPRTSAVLRFEREIAVLTGMPSSESLVRHLGHGADDDLLPWIASEFVDGPTFRDGMTRAGKLEPSVACQVIGRVCEAFSALHRSGLVHRDVRPEHILVDRNEAIKLVDFSFVSGGRDLLKLAETSDIFDGGPFTIELDGGRWLGSPEYLSPETAQQLLNPKGSTRTDTSSDVYSLGLIFYELLTGRVRFPFRYTIDRRDYPRLLASYLERRLSKASNWVPPMPRVDAELAGIVKSCLCLDPLARPQTTMGLKAQIDAYEANTESSAGANTAFSLYRCFNRDGAADAPTTSAPSAAAPPKANALSSTAVGTPTPATLRQASTLDRIEALGNATTPDHPSQTNVPTAAPPSKRRSGVGSSTLVGLPPSAVGSSFGLPTAGRSGTLTLPSLRQPTSPAGAAIKSSLPTSSQTRPGFDRVRPLVPTITMPALTDQEVGNPEAPYTLEQRLSRDSAGDHGLFDLSALKPATSKRQTDRPAGLFSGSGAAAVSDAPEDDLFGALGTTRSEDSAELERTTTLLAWRPEAEVEATTTLMAAQPNSFPQTQPHGATTSPDSSLDPTLAISSADFAEALAQSQERPADADGNPPVVLDFIDLGAGFDGLDEKTAKKRAEKEAKSRAVQEKDARKRAEKEAKARRVRDQAEKEAAEKSRIAAEKERVAREKAAASQRAAEEKAARKRASWEGRAPEPLEPLLTQQRKVDPGTDTATTRELTGFTPDEAETSIEAALRASVLSEDGSAELFALGTGVETSFDGEPSPTVDELLAEEARNKQLKSVAFWTYIIVVHAILIYTLYYVLFVWNAPLF